MCIGATVVAAETLIVLRRRGALGLVSLSSRRSVSITISITLKEKAEPLDDLRTSATVIGAFVSCEEADDVAADVSPFDEIYDTYAPLLRKIAVSRFGIPTSDAADLVHDVFATYLVNPKRVEELRPYLIGAICNASRSYRRKTNGRNEVCSGLDVCDLAEDTSVHERVVREVLIGQILGRLGRSCRDALHRFYIHGETAAVIAERRDTTPGYIGRLLHFCRKRALDAYRAMEKGKR